MQNFNLTFKNLDKRYQELESNAQNECDRVRSEALPNESKFVQETMELGKQIFNLESSKTVEIDYEN